MGKYTIVYLASPMDWHLNWWSFVNKNYATFNKIVHLFHFIFADVFLGLNPRSKISESQTQCIFNVVRRCQILHRGCTILHFCWWCRRNKHSPVPCHQSTFADSSMAVKLHFFYYKWGWVYIQNSRVICINLPLTHLLISLIIYSGSCWPLSYQF